MTHIFPAIIYSVVWNCTSVFFPIYFRYHSPWVFLKPSTFTPRRFKAGLHAKICRANMSARQCRGENRTSILTPDSTPIRENENRPDSKNLLQYNRFYGCRADTLKEAAASIKMLWKGMCENTWQALKIVSVSENFPLGFHVGTTIASGVKIDVRFSARRNVAWKPAFKGALSPAFFVVFGSILSKLLPFACYRGKNALQNQQDEFQGHFSRVS